MGSATACSGVLNHLPLWYAKYSGGASCGDYSALPFGGWDRAYAKQYADNTGAGLCGIKSADQDVVC